MDAREALEQFVRTSALGNLTLGALLMIAIGLFFLYLAIAKGFEPMLLVPIGFGIVLGNIPYDVRAAALGVKDGPVPEALIAYIAREPIERPGVRLAPGERISDPTLGQSLVAEGRAVMVHTREKLPYRGEFRGPGVYPAGGGHEVFVVAPDPKGTYPKVIPPEQQNEENASVLWFLSRGVMWGIFPPLIFLGIGAMIDFGPLLANPRLILLGAAAQIGIFGALLGALALGFELNEAASIGLIGAADGPTTIFACTRLAPDLLGAVALSAYSYMAMVPIIQPPIMRLCTRPEERRIRMHGTFEVSRRARILFPLVAFLLTALFATAALPLLGMLFLGNLLRESLVVDRLSQTASNALIDIVTILLGLSVGAKTRAETFLTLETIGVFLLGLVAFSISTAGGIYFAKLMNRFSKTPVNPLIGAAGISALPMSSRVVHAEGLKADPHNYLLMHAMAANVAGQIGSAVAGGILLAFFLR